tara:strand:+ start:512 stop:1741 length:1230 start_codon:yes stop_codon:yes gene_type:complete
MEVDFESIDFGKLLRDTKTYVIDLLNDYNTKYTEGEEKMLFESIRCKNKSLGMIHDELMKSEFKYYDYWYDNTLNVTGNFTGVPRLLYKSLCEYVGTDFSIYVYKKKPIVLKNDRIIKYGCYQDDSQKKIIKNLFYFIMDVHKEIYSFTSSFDFDYEKELVIYKKRVVTEWVEQEINCMAYDTIVKSNVSRALFPVQLYYYYKEGALIKIDLELEMSNIGFIIDKNKILYNVDSDTDIRDLELRQQMIEGFKFSKDNFCKYVILSFDCDSKIIDYKYYNQKKEEMDFKIGFVTNPRRYSPIKNLACGYSNVNTEFTKLGFNSYAMDILNQTDKYFEKKNYFNVFELMNCINSSELVSKSTRRFIKNNWRKWAFKTPSTRTFAMICLTGRGGLPRLPIEMIEYIIQFMIG